MCLALAPAAAAGEPASERPDLPQVAQLTDRAWACPNGAVVLSRSELRARKACRLGRVKRNVWISPIGVVVIGRPASRH